MGRSTTTGPSLTLRSAMITYDPKQKLFLLTTRSSVYAFRVLPSGELVHVCFRPSAGETASYQPEVTNVEAYPNQEFAADTFGYLYELPVAGDVHHHAVALR